MFILIGIDLQNNMTAPIAKRKFDTIVEAEEHARTVLNSGGNSNVNKIVIMNAVSVAQRTSPPVEVIPYVDQLSFPEVKKAA